MQNNAAIVSMQTRMREMEAEVRTSNEKMEAESEELKKMVKTKDRKIENLEVELGKARKDEADKDASLGRLMKELRDVRERENEAAVKLSEKQRKIQELEGEVERKRKSESSMARQLDSAMFDLEESKIEIASLHEKIDGLEDLCNHMSKEVKSISSEEQDMEISRLKSDLAQAQEGEKMALMRAERLSEEMVLLKKEWKFAMEGEDKSSKAMEDLAMALKEVATEANQAKEEVAMKEEQIQALKLEVAEAKQEAEVQSNTAERLRVEAEETLFAWNAKEIGFVSCIKRAEEERAMAQIENHKLSESLKAAENMTRSAREETYKLRDILKQAINESNAAKAAAGIARDENSLLKDCLAEKEEALHFITRENERLRISEAAAQEHVKQLKRMLTMATSAEIKLDDKDEIGIVMFHDAMDEEDHHLEKKVNREFSFDLDDLKFMNQEAEEDEALDEDPEKAEALKGSIFDTSAETPKSEAKTPKSIFFRMKNHGSSPKNEEEEGAKGEEGVEQGHDESEGDKGHGHRRTKTMFQRVGGLLTIRKSFIHRKEPSTDQKSTPTQTQTPT